MTDFTGKTCFVTGGSNGIGQAIVEAFHGASARVVFCDIEQPKEHLEGMVFRQLDVAMLMRCGRL